MGDKWVYLHVCLGVSRMLEAVADQPAVCHQVFNCGDNLDYKFMGKCHLYAWLNAMMHCSSRLGERNTHPCTMASAAPNLAPTAGNFTAFSIPRMDRQSDSAHT